MAELAEAAARGDDREAALMKKMTDALDEYCLTAIGKAAAWAYLRPPLQRPATCLHPRPDQTEAATGKLREDDMRRVLDWWLRKCARERRGEAALQSRF